MCDNAGDSNGDFPGSDYFTDGTGPVRTHGAAPTQFAAGGGGRADPSLEYWSTHL